MNTTERRARKWLAELKGIKESEIVYSSSSTPDFTLPDGSMYEVKLLYRDKLILFPSQLDVLSARPQIQVAVFRANEWEPTAIISAGELAAVARSEKKQWRNIKLVVYSNTLRITLPDEVWRALGEYCGSMPGEGGTPAQGRLGLAGPKGARAADVAKLAIVEFLERKGLLEKYKWATED